MARLEKAVRRKDKKHTLLLGFGVDLKEAKLRNDRKYLLSVS